MKTYLIINIIILSFLTNSFAQNNETKIKEIRSHFKWINSQKNYEIYTLNNNDYLDYTFDGGATAKGFFKGKNLYKVEERIGKSTENVLVDYYYWDNNPIFVYYRVEEYGYNENTGEIDYNNTSLGFEGRYYYDNGKLIKTLLKKANSYKPTDGDKMLQSAKTLLLYLNVRKNANEEYEKLQGKWQDTSDPNQVFEVEGMTQTIYYEDGYMGWFRMLIEDGYLYQIDPEEQNEILKFQILKLTDNEFDIMYIPSGRITKYKKIK